MRNFSQRLINWYEANKRDLPWRHTNDPYKVWLSEIILQQTRVHQGISYYYKFTRLFPTVSDLANATEDEVLKAWQGLGYYSRARNLHASAKFIHHDNGGKFPESAKGLEQLKGVGPYTAAAIASFCYGEKVAVIDGNVMRVLSRIFGVELPVDSTDGKKVIEKIAAEIISKSQPGQHNQAMMELGAIQCRPSSPDCESCPFAAVCVAYKSGRVNDFPLKEKKTSVKNIWYYYFVIHHGENVYLKRREGKGIWRGLYDFPLIETNESISEKIAISDFFKSHSINKEMVVTGVSEVFKHVLTHRKIHAVFIEMILKDAKAIKGYAYLSINKQSMKDYGIPRLVEKYLESNIAWKNIMA